MPYGPELDPVTNKMQSLGGGGRQQPNGSIPETFTGGGGLTRAGHRRVCFTMQFTPSRLDEYLKDHEAIWPEMQQALVECGWHNYSLFYRPDGFAVGYFETSSELYPDSSQGYLGLGLAYLRTGDAAQALPALERGPPRLPRHPRLGEQRPARVRSWPRRPEAGASRAWSGCTPG